MSYKIINNEANKKLWNSNLKNKEHYNLQIYIHGIESALKWANTFKKKYNKKNESDFDKNDVNIATNIKDGSLGCFNISCFYLRIFQRDSIKAFIKDQKAIILNCSSQRFIELKRQELLKGHIEQDDIFYLSKKLKISNTRVYQLIKKHQIKYFSKAKLAQKKQNEYLYEFQTRLLENSFIKYDGYWINKHGKIFKKLKGRFKECVSCLRKNNWGMISLPISFNSKLVYMHKLIAKLFAPNLNNYKYVSIKNGDFMNLNIDHLMCFEYLAYKRVTKSFVDNIAVTWLKFIIDNFINGIKIHAISKIIANKTTRDNNHNQESVVQSTIGKHSQENKKFSIFKISNDLSYSIFLNKQNIKPLRELSND